MRLFRRLKTKYGITHPFCVLSLLACLVFCGLIVGYMLMHYTPVSDAARIAGSTNVSPEELQAFGEEVFDTIIGSYAQSVAIGIEPFLAVLVQGLAGLVNAVIGMPFDIETTYFSIPEVFLIVLVIFTIGKLMQCFECTRSFTMLTYGEFERIFGYLLMVMVSCQNITKIIYVCEKHKLMLENLFGSAGIEWIVAAFVFWTGLFSAILGIMIFYITKTLVLGLQIMQLSISFFPFTSLLFEVLRSSVTVLFAVFNLLFPKVGFAFNCTAFVVGIVFLAQTSSSVEYFRVIYLESLLIPYYRFKGKITQLYKDVPTEIRKKCKNGKGIIIPVFSMDHFDIGDVDVAGHEKWWMEIAVDGLYFYRKKFLSRKVESFFIAQNDKKWYFRDNWKCLEIFNLNGPQENIIRLFKKPEREMAFVVSREYEAVFKDITEGMHATDYNALKVKLTEERRTYIEKENKAFYAITQ